MQCFILLGSLLQVLLVMSYAESNSRRERRDLTTLGQYPTNELFKRTTSPPNPITCPSAIEGNPDLVSDLRDVNKVVTYAVKHQVSCAVFQTALFVVFTLDGQPAAFEYTTAKDVKSMAADFIQQDCIIERPKTFNQCKMPNNPDVGKGYSVAWFNPPVPGEQVTTCSPELTEQAIATMLEGTCGNCN